MEGRRAARWGPPHGWCGTCFITPPARLKFMKKDAAEGLPCSRWSSGPLSHPEVSVVPSGRKQELPHPGTDNCKAPSTPFWAGSWPWASPG